jgi:superfamily II DNA/RNA helicase
VFDVLVGINLLREGIDLPEVTLVAILDADKEGFLRSAWSLIQMIGRAARNTGGEVVMYADHVTESMQVAIDETNRRRAIQTAYNDEKGIEPTTIVKGIHDLNQRLRAVAESTVVYASERPGEFSDADRAKVEALVGRMEAEMRSAAKELEFERAAALRDEIQQVRLRVLEQDASVTVARAAERAAADASRAGAGSGLTGAADRARGRRASEAATAAGPIMEVTSVAVLSAEDEPAATLDGMLPGGEAGDGSGEADASGEGEGTVSDWLPGIRDEHDDEGGWQARWLERPTWDRAVTPNIRRRTGQRPGRRQR